MQQTEHSPSDYFSLAALMRRVFGGPAKRPAYRIALMIEPQKIDPSTERGAAYERYFKLTRENPGELIRVAYTGGEISGQFWPIRPGQGDHAAPKADTLRLG